jgi:hypothetical protein
VPAGFRHCCLDECYSEPLIARMGASAGSTVTIM